jgi:SAM-dependent methyltransferase
MFSKSAPLIDEATTTQGLSSCPLCDHERWVYLFTIYKLRIEICDNCGFCRQSKQVDSTVSVADHANWQTSTEQQVSKDYLQILKKQVTGKSVLLVAPDQHPFIKQATAEGYQVDTAEFSDELYAPKSEYDAVVVIFSLSEVPNPIKLLEQLRAVLKPEGLLILVEAMLDSWPAKLFKRNWIGWTGSKYYYFDSQTLQSGLLRAGFNEISIRADQRRYSFDHIYDRANVAPKTWLTSIISLANRLLPKNIQQKTWLRLSTSGVIVSARPAEKRERPLLSVVMPVYNERATVAETLQLVLDKQVPGVDKEVIVVESNSTDGTRDIVLQFKDHPEIKLIFEERPRGKGHAVRTGLQHVRGDFILIQDADREYDVNDYDILVNPLKQYHAPFVLGSRHTKGHKLRDFASQPGLSAFYNIGHSIFCSLFNITYGQHLKDPFTMYKVFRRDCIYGIQFECNRFDFDYELVIKLLRKGYSAIEIPVNYSSRSFKEGKKVSTFRDPITWIVALIKFRFAQIYTDDYLSKQ